MPELPEVETIVRELRPQLTGRRLGSVSFSRKALRRPWLEEWTPQLLGRRVQQVRRRGKWIVLDLDADLFLVFHMGMTGQLTVVPHKQETAPHTHLVLGLDRGGKELRFRDIRRFGSVSLFMGSEALEQFFAASGLGPEPFDLDPTSWRKRLKGTQRCLKAVLLDQRVVAGVGNIYADESLFEAGLHPGRSSASLKRSEAERLREAIAQVLQRAIECRGSTIRNYVGGSGLAGCFQEEHRVYGRTGEPCRTCGTPIERTRLAGRSTHFCPRCQPGGQRSAVSR